jgi:hypothetical protein
MEYYSALKKNEIMLFGGKWMELENIIKQIKPDSKGHIFLHMWKLEL